MSDDRLIGQVEYMIHVRNKVLRHLVHPRNYSCMH